MYTVCIYVYEVYIFIKRYSIISLHVLGKYDNVQSVFLLNSHLKWYVGGSVYTIVYILLTGIYSMQYIL